MKQVLITVHSSEDEKAFFDKLIQLLARKEFREQTPKESLKKEE